MCTCLQPENGKNQYTLRGVLAGFIFLLSLKLEIKMLCIRNLCIYIMCNGVEQCNLINIKKVNYGSFFFVISSLENLRNY